MSAYDPAGGVGRRRLQRRGRLLRPREFPPDAGVRVYADDWKWGPNDEYRWREHEGRGYWGPKGAWIEF